MSILLLVLALTIATAAYIALAQSRDRSLVRLTLRRIEHFEIETAEVRQSELEAPLAQRVLVPALGALTRLSRRLTPADYVSKIRQRLVLAGHHDVEQTDRFMAARVLALLAVPASFYLGFWVLPLTGLS